MSRGSVALITADLRDERIPATTKQAFRPTQPSSRNTLMLFCLQIFHRTFLGIAQTDCDNNCTQKFSTLSCPKVFSRLLCCIKGQAMQCFKPFQATTAVHCTAAGVLFQLSTKLFRDGLHVRSVATIRFFDTIKIILLSKVLEIGKCLPTPLFVACYKKTGQCAQSG